MIRTYALAALATVAIVATPAMAATELVTNGGFETVSNNVNNFQVGGSGSAGSVTGWTISPTGGSDPYAILFHSNIATTTSALGRYNSSGLEYLSALPSNHPGVRSNNFMGLDGASAAPDNVASILSQTLTGLVVGYTYNLSFDWATGQLASRTGNTQNSLTVQIGNLNTTYGPVSNPSAGATDWTFGQTASFQATGTSQVLSFLAMGTPSGLPPMILLDNASVQLAVPEPSTWAMMLIGFGMVGAGLRRRRRTTLAAAV